MRRTKIVVDALGGEHDLKCLPWLDQVIRIPRLRLLRDAERVAAVRGMVSGRGVHVGLDDPAHDRPGIT